MYRRPSILALLLLSTLAAAGRAESPMTPEQLEFFEKKVRPVLAENCFSCHGPKKQFSNLRLDSHELLLKGGDGGVVVVPGKPEESSLISAIRYESYEMPPTGKMNDDAIAALESWVKMGAPWPKESPVTTAEQAAKLADTHWSFQPIRNPTPPEVKHKDWVRDPIDRFILAQLEEKGLTPSPIADKRTLIRRATIDLTGVPPTPEEIHNFLADESPESFGRVVDRLLESPRYGERWGRYWLDVARYADTKGYVFQDERRYPYSYTYRDYVINSFNNDLPIDRFIVEQLAADQLPKEEQRNSQALAAMGFLTVGRRFLNNVHDIIDDRIDVTTRGLMGLTVACARCHDHKFDPVPTADYYSLYGIFASSQEPDQLPELPSTAPPEQVAQFQKELSDIQNEIDQFLAGKQKEFSEKFRTRVADFLEAAYQMQFNPRHEKRESFAKKLDVDESLLGAFVERLKQEVQPRKKADDPVFGIWHAFEKIPADQFAAKASQLVSDLQQQNQMHPVIAEALLATPPKDMQEVVQRYGQALLTVAQAADPNDPAKQIIDAVAVLPKDQLPRAFNRADRDQFRKRESKLEALKASHPGAPPRAMVMVDKPDLYNPFVFVRGTPGRRGDSVPRRFLEVLSEGERKPFQNSSGRLEMAKEIVSDDNPLTARVFVNRVWLNHFGLGIVRTPSDFGVQGEPPTHPELLDHLAYTFREDGWSLKRLHRRIMLSSTYQQESHIRPDCQQADPENRLVWRQNRRRLDFEAMRDSLLFVAANLDESKGGKSVDITSDNYSNRRSVYGFIDRQNLEGLFRTFDLASPNASSPQRFVTTVPQQALFLMNSKFIADQSRKLAQRIDSLPVEERIGHLYETLLGRPAEPEEMSLALQYVNSRQETAVVTPGWHYGFGLVDEQANKLASYTPLAKWVNNRWQFGDEYPDPQVGHLVIGSGSGHPGRSDEYSTVLRWVAPADAAVRISGHLRHKSDQGDGVKGYVVSSSKGIVGTWVAHNKGVQTTVERLEIAAGETVDFVVAPQKTNSFDSYEWSPVVSIEKSEQQVAKVTWDAKADFHGPLPPPPTPWQLYAQALLMSNEFNFVD